MTVGEVNDVNLCGNTTPLLTLSVLLHRIKVSSRDTVAGSVLSGSHPGEQIVAQYNFLHYEQKSHRILDRPLPLDNASFKWNALTGDWLVGRHSDNMANPLHTLSFYVSQEWLCAHPFS